MPPAHPRRCGENVYFELCRCGYCGSSPQVRGKLGGCCALPLAGRLIPAGAGKTYMRASLTSLAAAHPRRCGENLRRRFSQSISLGSSPQVRGKPARSYQVRPAGRLIPAGAGKTKTRLICACVVIPAHPRRCGENDVGHMYITDQTGSSPQVRGKRELAFSFESAARLIPAGAGKTKAPSHRTPLSTAHPRRCGENMVMPLFTCLLVGSSPQVRGKRRVRSGARGRGRLIPAGAGKTRCTSPKPRCSKAHPRRCGENRLGG